MEPIWAFFSLLSIDLSQGLDLGGKFVYANTIRFNDNPMSVESLCQTSFSNTIAFDDKTISVENLCQTSIFSPIRFDGTPKSVENLCSDKLQKQTSISPTTKRSAETSDP